MSPVATIRYIHGLRGSAVAAIISCRFARFASIRANPSACARPAACLAASASVPAGIRNETFPAAASPARVARSGYWPATRASQAGSATPCSRPVWSRTASTSRFTSGMPSASAPDSPPSLSTARSTETVVWARAIATIGSPAWLASLLASRTTCGSMLSLGVLGREPDVIVTLPSSSRRRSGGRQVRS